MPTFFGIIGLIIISIAIWIKDEKKQSLIFVVAGCFLLIYSMDIGNIIFISLQIIFIVSALAKFFIKLKGP